MDGWFPVGLPTLLSFATASLLIELTPGPNMSYLAIVAASEGRRAGFATVAGVALGLGIVGFVAALGVAEIVQASPLLYEGLRWAGVAFLLYLAWEGWRSSNEVSMAGAEEGRYFRRGLVTNLLNPKAAVFYIAVLPTFLDGASPALPQMLVLSAVSVTIATAVHAGIVGLAGTLENFLNDPKRERTARRLFSVLLGLVAVWFAWSTAS
ncbi:LysE family translocator [Pseudaminobacter soli (ex Zhang et al. 2022)]|uniref:LysE family translocator n=1 Tax=Pseudaminobacter soli (ex Zhang et al. 2022) TaxID=2831468 RepID=UPI002356A13E|nr:LysE family translocator [Pseudaminobacter soli]